MLDDSYDKDLKTKLDRLNSLKKTIFREFSNENTSRQGYSDEDSFEFSKSIVKGNQIPIETKQFESDGAKEIGTGVRGTRDSSVRQSKENECPSNFLRSAFQDKDMDYSSEEEEERWEDHQTLEISKKSVKNRIDSEETLSTVKNGFESEEKLAIMKNGILSEEKLSILKKRMTNEERLLIDLKRLQKNELYMGDKSGSEIDLGDSVIDQEKETFKRLRDELYSQLDTERGKNHMMEQKLLSRDKSFIEIKSQFNQLLLNYESKQKECEMLHKYHENNQFHQDEKEKMKLKDKQENLNKRGSRSYQNDDSEQERQQSQQFCDRQTKEIKTLRKEVEDTRMEMSRARQRVIELEITVSQLQNELKNTDQRDILKEFQRIKESSNQLKETLKARDMTQTKLEEQLMEQKKECEELKNVLRMKDEQLRQDSNDEIESRKILHKTEKLLRQFEILKGENTLLSKKLSSMKENNTQLSSEVSLLRKNSILLQCKSNLIHQDEQSDRSRQQQQDSVIWRLNSEVESLRNRYAEVSEISVSVIHQIMKKLFSQEIFDVSLIQQALQREIEYRTSHENENGIIQDRLVNFNGIFASIESYVNGMTRYKNFSKVFKEMIYEVGKNELPISPTLNNCWKYFKVMFNQYLKLRIEDQINQTTSNILIKMLRLKNEHEIVIAVQNLITLNEKLKHLESLHISMTSSPYSRTLPPQVSHNNIIQSRNKLESSDESKRYSSFDGTQINTTLKSNRSSSKSSHINHSKQQISDQFQDHSPHAGVSYNSAPSSIHVVNPFHREKQEVQQYSSLRMNKNILPTSSSTNEQAYLQKDASKIRQPSQTKPNSKRNLSTHHLKNVGETQ